MGTGTNHNQSDHSFRYMFLIIALVCLVVFPLVSHTPISSKKIEATYRTKPIPTFKTRFDLGGILEDEGFETGVELGVQKGLFAERLLSKWTNAKLYVLVDLWANQKNYLDGSNVVNAQHINYKQQALNRTMKFQARGTTIEVCQDYTTNCAKKYFGVPQFDFIYVDARHDYKGVLQDLENWWPVLKPGGIMAGHDYVTNDDGPMQSRQNWTVNFDGTVDPTGRAVKGAVDDFMMAKQLQLVVTYREPRWNTWAVRKPFN